MTEQPNRFEFIKIYDSLALNTYSVDSLRTGMFKRREYPKRTAYSLTIRMSDGSRQMLYVYHPCN